MTMTIIDNRSIKKPSRLRVGDEALNRAIDFDYRRLLKDLSHRPTRQGLLDYVAYRGPIHIVIISLESSQHGTLLHTSISRSDADPTWAAIKALKAVVFGDKDVMMVLPKAELYCNIHEHCFHLWQMPTDWGIG